MNFKKIHVNVYVGVAIAIFALFFLKETGTIAARNPDAALFPRLILFGMLIIAVFLIVQSILVSEEVPWKTEKKDVLRVLAMFGGMILFALLFQQIGYILSMMIVLGIGLFLFGHENKRTVIIVTILVPIVLYVSFTLLRVRLPGLLAGFF